MREADKRKVPAHGYLGQFYGKNVKEVRDHIKRTYQITTSDKIVVNTLSNEPPGKIYEVEIIPTKRK